MVAVVNSQWSQTVVAVVASGRSRVSEGCARHSIEEAERRDGGAIACHAAPADWPAAKRRYASGEDSGERRTAHVSVHMT